VLSLRAIMAGAKRAGGVGDSAFGSFVEPTSQNNASQQNSPQNNASQQSGSAYTPGPLGGKQ